MWGGGHKCLDFFSITFVSIRSLCWPRLLIVCCQKRCSFSLCRFCCLQCAYYKPTLYYYSKQFLKGRVRFKLEGTWSSLSLIFFFHVVFVVLFIDFDHFEVDWLGRRPLVIDCKNHDFSAWETELLLLTHLQDEFDKAIRVLFEESGDFVANHAPHHVHLTHCGRKFRTRHNLLHRSLSGQLCSNFTRLRQTNVQVDVVGKRNLTGGRAKNFGGASFTTLLFCGLASILKRLFVIIDLLRLTNGLR